MSVLDAFSQSLDISVVGVSEVVHVDDRISSWIWATEGDSSSGLRLDKVAFNEVGVWHWQGEERNTISKRDLHIEFVSVDTSGVEGSDWVRSLSQLSSSRGLPLLDVSLGRWVSDRVLWLGDVSSVDVDESRVILEVSSNSFDGSLDGDSVGRELISRSISRQHEDLWCFKRSSSQDDFTISFGFEGGGFSIDENVDTSDFVSIAVGHQGCDNSVSHNSEVEVVNDRVQIVFRSVSSSSVNMVDGLVDEARSSEVSRRRAERVWSDVVDRALIEGLEVQVVVFSFSQFRSDWDWSRVGEVVSVVAGVVTSVVFEVDEVRKQSKVSPVLEAKLVHPVIV